MMKLINKIATRIYQCGRKHSMLFSSPQVAQSLARLYPGVAPDSLMEQYYVKKIGLSFVVCVLGIVFGAIIHCRAQIVELDSSEGISRGTFQEGTKEIDLEGTFGGEAQQFHIRIEPQRLQEEEVEELYHAFCTELSDRIKGQNSSLKQVEKNLCLEESYSEYPFVITWESSKPEIITFEGVVSEVAAAEDVSLKANICYEDFQRCYEISVTIVPPSMTQEERLRMEREQMLINSEADSRDAKCWVLPEEWQGEEIKWKQVKNDNGILLAGMAFGVAGLLFFMADKDLRDCVAKRRQNMREDYPEIVHKLILYMGAGLTIRNSFQKIADNYLNKNDKEGGAIYEEIRYLCRELQAGVSESVAYEHLGKRTGVQEYIKLSTLLTQNLKKGSNALLQRLQEEAGNANEVQMQYARKKGEEAETKLLLPMVMMLLVVMLMIMLPAFWTIGM